MIQTLGGDDVVDVVSLAGSRNARFGIGVGRRGSGCAERRGHHAFAATVTLAGDDGDDRLQIGTLSNVRAKSALNVHSLGSLRGHHGGVGRGRSRGRSAGAG